jgi:GDPmannose 4,6-dehydratase
VSHGYTVHGVVRPGTRDPANLAAIAADVQLYAVDIRDTDRLTSVVANLKPDEIYNFAAVSFGPDAWADPATTAEVGVVALTGLLDAVLQHSPRSRMFQASSSWVFGRATQSPQDESTPYRPTNPYGAVKAAGDFLLGAYRERYGLHLVSGILFNHESPRRPEQFVTRKITAAAARIARGSPEVLELGDTSSSRDWGFAGDFVNCAWRSLQVQEPTDYVVGTGRLHSVADVLDIAFGRVGLAWEDHVHHDTALVRNSADVPALVANPAKATALLGWEPSMPFDELVISMVEADLARRA